MRKKARFLFYVIQRAHRTMVRYITEAEKAPNPMRPEVERVMTRNNGNE